MSTLLQVWIVSSALLGGISLFIGLIGIPITHGYRDKGEARFILGCLIFAFVAPLWPVLLPAGLLYTSVGLWSDAGFETLAERRDRLAIERDARVREQARTIERLEREAGIR